MTKIFLFCLLLLVQYSAFGQLGGSESFAFLHLPVGAKQVSNGLNISSNKNDPNAFLANPALLSDTVNLQLSATYYAYSAGLSYSTAAFCKKTKALGNWAAALQNLSYGQMNRYDAAGNPQGTFSANDFALTVGHSSRINHFALGTNLRFVQSTIESYQANGLFADVGAAFLHPKKDLIIALTIKNLGTSLSLFTPDSRFVMPLNVIIGASYKPAKMPFRFSLTAQQLNRPDISYYDPANSLLVDAFGNPIKNSPSLADKILRHFIIGLELPLGKNLEIRGGYNFLTRREMRIEQAGGFTGFSFGFSLNIKRLGFHYANSSPHISTSTHAVSVNLNFR